MNYAAGTQVDPSKSRIEIEKLLEKLGCQRFGVMTEPGVATVYFERGKWCVQMRMLLPKLEDMPKRRANRWQDLTAAERQRLLEQATRERWRQMLLVLKAKFTALETGVETFEQTFFAHLVVGGVHVGDRLLAAVREANAAGKPLALTAGN